MNQIAHCKSANIDVRQWLNENEKYKQTSVQNNTDEMNIHISLWGDGDYLESCSVLFYMYTMCGWY